MQAYWRQKLTRSGIMGVPDVKGLPAAGGVVAGLRPWSRTLCGILTAGGSGGRPACAFACAIHHQCRHANNSTGQMSILCYEEQKFIDFDPW